MTAMDSNNNRIATKKTARLRRNPTVLAVETCSTTSVLNSVLSGYAAGVSGTMVGHPMDSAKVWMQTNTKSRLLSINTNPSNTTTTTQAATTTSATSGGKALQRAVGHHTTTTASSLKPNMSTLAAVGSQSPLSTSLRNLRALYSGVTGPLFTVGLVQSVNFAIYDSVRRMLYGMEHTTTAKTDMEYLHNDSLTNVGVASMTAGLVLSVFTSPMLIIKTKQQIQGSSFRQALQQTTMQDGRLSIGNIFRGFGPHVLSETLGRGIYFVAYEGIKRQFMARHENTTATTTATLQERMLSAALSGILCWSSIFPLDALRCRLYASAERQSAWDMATHMYRENGIRAFYRGYVVTVLRAGPVAAAVLPIYDTCLEKLSEMN